ncbi:hypothetical protein ACJ41O_000479 [Fusarium nematophilum]
MANKWTFKAQPGIFIELADIAHQYPGEKVTTPPSLGLIPGQEYPSDDPNASDQRDWVRLAAYVRWLNDNSPDNVSYKAVRPGIKVSFQNGNEKETWFDAFLTDVGVQQARDLNSFWTQLIDVDGAPLPEVLYTSPLARCLQTTSLVFSSVMESHSAPFKPIVKELLRERITLHTCDFRRPRRWIAQSYPDYVIEEGFTEEDGFAKEGREEETDGEHVRRKQQALEEIFEDARGKEVVSLTVHSYAIRAIQEAVGARACRTREGTSIALVVRGEEADDWVN